MGPVTDCLACGCRPILVVKVDAVAARRRGRSFVRSRGALCVIACVLGGGAFQEFDGSRPGELSGIRRVRSRSRVILEAVLGALV